ncbi:hypothetical protein MB02_08410 [Croceicoccus estronivorus]|uniref:hypothetical protein n=1 Tax=Croceicoccus estronivorus TaxID=1172626 RepID=UPI000830B970|nr:hypothetical protein [Croceicoccus estronivorus]OCC23844.1 hypothetical protein MB02_08410 [Croceicoccus estronivorus]
MRGISLAASLAAALLAGSAATAQEEVSAQGGSVEAAQETPAEIGVPDVPALTEAVEPTPVCELHVFPTVEGQAQTTSLLTGLGGVWAVADAAANKNRNITEAEYLKDALGPKFQVQALESIDLAKELKLPADTTILYEMPIADRDITTKSKTRLTDSTASCYAELLVTQNLYLKKVIYGRSLNNRFIYKDFREGKSITKMIKGRGGNGLSHFPPKTADEIEEADEDLRQAFTRNFLEYSSRL